MKKLIFLFLLLPVFGFSQNYNFFFGTDTTQSLSLSNDTLSLVPGNSIVLPSGGGGIISALPVGDVDITADSSKFVIDSLGRYKITTETGEFLIAGSVPGNGNSLLIGKKNPGDALGNLVAITENAAGIICESAAIVVQSSQQVEMQSSTMINIGSPQITLSGANVELSGNNISILPGSSLEVDELSYPFTATAFDTAALVFNQDGTGYLLDLPEYIAGAGGGGGIPDLLPVQDVTIDADSTALVIDSLSSLSLLTKGASSIFLGQNEDLEGAETFYAAVGGARMILASAGFALETEAGGMYFEEGTFAAAAETIVLVGETYLTEDDILLQNELPSVNNSAWLNNTDGSGQWFPLVPQAGAGSPAVAPRYNGDRYFDVTNSKWYFAWDNEDGDGTGDGLDTDDWVILN